MPAKGCLSCRQLRKQELKSLVLSGTVELEIDDSDGEAKFSSSGSSPLVALEGMAEINSQAKTCRRVDLHGKVLTSNVLSTMKINACNLLSTMMSR